MVTMPRQDNDNFDDLFGDFDEDASPPVLIPDTASENVWLMDSFINKKIRVPSRMQLGRDSNETWVLEGAGVKTRPIATVLKHELAVAMTLALCFQLSGYPL